MNNKEQKWLNEKVYGLSETISNVDGKGEYVGISKNAVLSLIDELERPEITEEQAWEVIGGYNGMTAKEANQMFADGMVNRKSDKSIKRDDVLDRLQEIGEHNRNEWIEVILRKFGNDYGAVKYQAGHEQGYLNGILKSKEDELVEIPQFVADRIEEYKEIQFGISLIFMINRQIDDDVKFSKWLSSDKNNCDKVARGFLDGYTIEKEPRWIVKRENGDYVELFEDSLYGLDVSVTSSLDVVSPHRFTDKAKAEAVALLVGGTVKEIPEDEAMKLIEGWKEDEILEIK